jgi:hypothetical protein
MFKGVNISVSTLAVTMLAGSFALTGNAWARSAAESSKVTRLYSDARVQAQQLKEDADAMEAYSRSDLSWQWHVDAINKIRDDVNNLGRLLQQMDEDSVGAAPWQQTALDNIKPLAVELANDTVVAIDRLNRYPERVNTGDFQHRVDAIVESADHLAAKLDNRGGNF